MKTKFPMHLDKYYVYCPPITDKSLDKLRSEYWKRNSDLPPGDLIEIFQNSPKQSKKALELLARNFNRESEYDLDQYSATEVHDPRRLGAFLWVERCLNNDYVDNRAIGGICFRYRDDYVEERKEFNGWALQWVYVHPNHRRNGLLSDAWDYFKDRYGGFIVEDPFSTQMSFFLAKHGIPHKDQQRFYDSSLGPKGTRWRAFKNLVETVGADN